MRNLRILIYPVRGVTVTSYKVEAKAPRVRIHIGTLPTEEAAREAGEKFLATGRKPSPARRGPKGPWRNTEQRRKDYRPAPRVPLSREVASRHEMFRAILRRIG